MVLVHKPRDLNPESKSHKLLDTSFLSSTLCLGDLPKGGLGGGNNLARVVPSLLQP